MFPSSTACSYQLSAFLPGPLYPQISARFNTFQAVIIFYAISMASPLSHTWHVLSGDPCRQVMTIDEQGSDSQSHKHRDFAGPDDMHYYEQIVL